MIGLFLSHQQVFSTSGNEANEFVDQSDGSEVTMLTRDTQTDQVEIIYMYCTIIISSIKPPPSSKPPSSTKPPSIN